METLQIEKSNAILAYNKADDKAKKLLANLFGEKVFSQKITDRVKTYEDACEVLGIDPDDSLPGETDSQDNEALLAVAKLFVIARALNEGWKPDWTKSSETKYYPWFDMKTGSCLSYHAYDYTSAATAVGSRLCFKTADLAKYAGQQFVDLYKAYFII